ncbi:MAG TPA: nuclear transport factor 2 family protein [Parafilimonas sp.]|nr:nuclear transport factor 2 family protein [Parafilimonas sp.]
MKDMATNDAECVSKWFTEESTLWIPPASPIKGLCRIKALFRAMFGRYEYLRWTIVDILPVCENRCIHICESQGKLKGSDAYNNRVITDIIFNDEGKILSLSDYFKDTAVFYK